MATKSIEERAENLYSDFIDTIHDSDGGEVGYYLDGKTGEQLAIDALTEQDQIARQEERERCIQMAQLRECKRCKDNDKCWLCDDCTIMQDVRKAMEGGEV